MKKKLISLLIASVTMLFTLSGCGKETEDDTNVEEEFKGKTKAELIQMYKDLEDEIKMLDDDYNDLYLLLEGIQSEDAPTSAIGITGDGTGRFTFNSVDSKIVFPDTFKYPDSTQVTSNSKVSILDNVVIQPGTNWILKLNGSTLELEHSSGISGTIKIGKQSKVYTAAELKEQVLSQWFDGVPANKVSYSDISVGKYAYGAQAVTSTLIDGEDAYLRCGMCAEGSYSVTYVFVYRGTKDSNKDESITTLLNSIKLNGVQIIVEQ